MSFSPQEELFGLLESLCEATITDQQWERLRQLLRDDIQAERLYIEYMLFAADLRKTLSVCSDHMVWPVDDLEPLDRDEAMHESRPADTMASGVDGADQTYWEANARKEAIRVHAEWLFERFKADEKRRQEELAYKQYLARRRRLFIGVGSLAALLVVLLLAWLFRPRPEPMESVAKSATPAPPPVVARITQSLNARWLQEDLSTEAGTSLVASSVYLAEGLIQVVFDGGTEAIIQAPADLRLEDVDQVFLHAGAISARMVSGSSGFIVRTPTGTVVDYGTAFGVVVNQAGETEAFVYEGKVGLRSGSDPVRSVDSRVLTEGQGGAVDTSGNVLEREFRPRQVIREMPEAIGFGIPGRRFDLADAMVGGNGFGTGDPNQLVDIRTGTLSTIRPDSVNLEISGLRGRSAPGLPFVDYLFIANGDAGRTAVSSAGNRFAECPDTGGNAYFYISNCGLLRHVPGRVADAVLDGQQYGTRTHPGISMHANAGVTFDLQAIRDYLPGARIARFTVLCGVSETANTAQRLEQGGISQRNTDFWVLVDGEVCFSHRNTQPQSAATRVNVELGEGSRFLTLVVTDGGDGINYDWGVFAEPALELDQVERASEPLRI